MHFNETCTPFYGVSCNLCHVSSVICSMSRFMRHLSLVPKNNDHSNITSPSSFHIIRNRLIHRGMALKKGKNLKTQIIINTEKIGKIV